MSDRLLGWASQDLVKNRYFDFCELAASDDKEFANFKKHPHFTPILEHVDYRLGCQYLEIIKRDYSYFLENFDKFKINDTVGNPVLHDFPDIGITTGTTLRYVKTLGDLKQHVGDLSGMNIVEIGGGYGGQCLVTRQEFEFASWQILDLSSVAKLQRRYLQQHNIDVWTGTIDEFQRGQIDLVISNYAFSECMQETQDQYLREVIQHAQRGYFQINPDAVGCYQREESLANLKKFGKKQKVLPDMPIGSRYPNNFIYVFEN